MLDDFEDYAHRVSFREPQIEMFSTLTVTPVTKEIASSGYWRRHLRQPVQFESAMTWALSEPGTVFIEIGTSATLIGMARRFTAARDAKWIPTLRPGVDGEQSLLESLAELYSLGHRIDWEGFCRDRSTHTVALPTYPFQRKRYWIAPEGKRRDPVRTAADHPLLGNRLRLAQADGCLVWENTLGVTDVSYLKDHAVGGFVVFPGAAFTEMTASAARAAGFAGRIDIAGLEFSSPLVFTGDERQRIQTVIQRKGDVLECAIYSSAVDAGPDDGWRLHMRGVVRDAEYSGRLVAIADVEKSCPAAETGSDFYRRWNLRGNQWGAIFQSIERLRIGEGESIAWLRARPEVAGELGSYVIHPALLDSCVQTMAAGAGGDGAFVGKSVGRLHIAGPLSGELIASARWTRQSSRMLVGDLTVTDRGGRPLLMAEDLTFTFLDKAKDESWQQWLYTEEWEVVDLPASSIPEVPTTWLVVGRSGDWADACVARLQELGHRVHRLDDGGSSMSIDPAEQVQGIVCFVSDGDDSSRPEEMVQAIVEHMTAAARTVWLTSTLPSCRNTKVWFVTRDVWPANAGGAPPPAAALWGLCSAIAAEHSANWGGMIDIEKGTDPARSAELLTQAITRLTRCDKVRIGREIATPRLRAMKCPRVDDGPAIRADGAYLVTGGFGELGSAVALWLGARGARHIVLIGRSGMAGEEGSSPLQQLQDAGVQVTAVALDIGDGQAVKLWADSYARDGRVPVRGIIHAAGVVAKEAVAGITEEAALPVIKAKAGGIMALEQAFDLRSMDFVILFSSAAAILNSPFLGAYAAANAFLDNYAYQRSLAGYPITSIDWSTFAGGGMAALAEQAGDATFSRALRPLSVGDGMQVLGRLLGCREARVAVLPMAWEEWRRAYPAQAELAYWDLVVAGGARQKLEDLTLPGREELLALSREERQARIVNGLSRLVAHTLGAEPDGVDCGIPLTALGIDSLMALEIRARLEKVYGLTLSVVAIISGPSIEGLAQSLGEFLDSGPTTPPIAEVARSASPSDEIGHFPLSFNQYSQWLLSSMAPGVCAYHVSFSARLCGPLDTVALHRCLERLVQRHAALRTTYSVYNGEISQEVHATGEVSLVETDGAGWTEDDLYQGARRGYAEPFDLATGLLLRGHLFTRGPADRVLLLVVHHIACDGWSLWLLLEELGLLYGAETGANTARLPEITASYLDFTRRQREKWSRAAELTAGKEFWSRQLADAPLVLELATDYPRPATESLSGASHPILVSPQTTRRLKRMARELNTTMFTLLMAAYQVLLHRITDQDRILVGSPTAGRTDSDTVRTVGHFVNMIVIRGDLAGNPPWRTFVEAMRRTIIDALEHQDFPFHLLVEHLQPQRTPGRSPIFQVDFTYQRAHTHAELIDFMGGTSGETRIRWGEMELAPFVVPQQEGQFDLSLEMAEGEQSLFGFLKYNSDLFRPETIADLSRSFCTILESVCEAPETGIDEIVLLDGQQRHTILQWARSTARPVPNCCLHELFAAQVAAIPNEQAVVCGDRFLTYRQLDMRANGVARYLQDLGVGSNSVVGVCLDRSPELIASILGILKAGGAYLPLDPALPASRRSAMLIDCGATVLICAHASALPGVIVCDPSLHRAPADSFAVEKTVSPADLAYVIYTSGSSGTPKGVMIEHRSVVNLLTGLDEAIYSRYTGRQQVSLFASTVFDASVQQIFGALCGGHTLHVLTEECRRDGGRLIEYWRRVGVTIADSTPTLLGMLLDAGLAEAEGLSLRHLIVGGEPLSRETVNRLRAGGVGRSIGLTNIYGPTECCVDVTAMDLSAGDLPDLPVMPIGRPMVNVQAYILDRNGLPVVPGWPGELHIGGPCVGRGYLNRDDLTAERFIASPFEPGTRLYRTGDRVRFLPGGVIAFLGRLDNQVKIRGFRIEPGEIEHHLRCCPRVRDCVVVAREDVPGDRRLVAYLVMDGGPASLEEIRGPLIAELPDYMIPASFVVLPSLPLNSSGKVDRNALPAPSAGAVMPGASSARPQTEFEREVAAIWREIIGLQEVGIHDNFFDLGGNSLLLTRVQIRLQAVLGRPVPMTALFRFPTIHALAEFCAGDEHQPPSTRNEEEGGSRRQRGRAAGLGTVRRSFRKTIAETEEE
jgi:amino acid adenylation domain-containing protein